MNKTKNIYYLRLKSYDALMIQSLVNLWKNCATIFGLELQGPIFMPLKKSKVIVIRSPHIYKKSREAFHFVNYKALVILSVDATKFNLVSIHKFVKLITKHLIAGVSFKITKMI